jgi:hypothetical protein
MDDLQGWKVQGTQIAAHRGHSSSVLTLILVHFTQQAPTVSFVHDFPGGVRSGIARGTTGLLGGVLAVANFVGPLLMYVPEKESGERHLFYMTSVRYRAKEGGDNSVPLLEGVEVARGIDGVEGSGLYSADQKNENAGREVEVLLGSMREEGMAEKVWESVEAEYSRIAKLPKE